MEYIVESPIGKHFRIKQENLHIIHKKRGWKVQRGTARFYNLKTKKINKKYVAVKELRTEKDIDKVGVTYESEFELLFGRLSKVL